MKLKELKILIDAILVDGPNKSKAEDLEVVIETFDQGMVQTPTTKIVGSHEGFDWDSGKLFLHTEHKLVKQTRK